MQNFEVQELDKIYALWKVYTDGETFRGCAYCGSESLFINTTEIQNDFISITVHCHSCKKDDVHTETVFKPKGE